MEAKIKRVLVTGSNGLLGQKLTDLYLTKKHKTLIATGRGESRHPNTGTFIYERMDISNPEEVERVIKKHKPDCIIHGAAMTQVDDCEKDPELCHMLNVKSVEYLTQAANEVGAHLILVSTDFIFDGENGPYKESDIPSPLSIYGQSKLDAENYVRAHAKSWSIARTVLVYGLVADMSRSNIVLWAKKALEEEQKINVVHDQYRSPTLAEDLAMGCFLIEDQNAEGIYNISGKDFMNIFELVQRVADYFGLSTKHVRKISSKELNQPAKRPPVTGFDLSKSTNELGYNPHSFEEGIRLLMDQLKTYEKN
jgi:dTDP-4-dehydrorhamnose reductase